MSRQVLTNAEMQAVILAGGSVLVNCRTHSILATKIEQLPDDNEILNCFPLVPLPEFDQDDLNANAIGILGKYFSGTPANGDTIKYNATSAVWEFTPLSVSLGVIGVTNGGTGLSAIVSNSLLYSPTANTLAAASIGSTVEVSAGSFNVKPDTTVQKIDIAANNSFVGSRKRLNFVAGSNVTLGVIEDTIGNKFDITISASSSAGSRWDQLADPIGNLTLNHGSSNTVFSWGSATAGNSLLQLKDSNGNTGNGYILDVTSGTGSLIKLARFTASGTTNGVLIDSTGKLQAIGTGNVEASSLKGITINGLAVRTTSGFVSRSLQSTSSGIVVTNEDGVSGNILLSLSDDVVVGVDNDTNIVGSIASGILTLSWLGSLAKARQNSATVYNDQNNTYVAGNKQSFVGNATNAAFNVSGSAGDPSALSNGDVWRNSTTGKVRLYENGQSYDLIQYLCHKKMLSNSVATSLFEVDLQPSTSTAVIVDYAIHASDGTNAQVRSGSIRLSAVNKSGTVVKEDFVSTEGVSPSIGTLTVAWVIEEGVNKVTVKSTATSSLTPNTFYVKYYIKNLSEQTITVL